MNDADLQDVKARLYGGSVSGKTRLDWREGLQVKGDYSVNAVELRELVPLFSPKTRLSGRLTAKPVFSGNAAKPDQLMNVLRLDTPFELREGVLQGIDIQKAATSLISKDSSGETRFDRLSGHYALDRGTQRITQLQVASGSLAADGQVTIAPNKSLSGRINAQVKAGSAGSVAVPLNISGTVGSPMALPTGASMAVRADAAAASDWQALGLALRAQAGWEFVDASVIPGANYAYRIEGQRTDGSLAHFGPVTARAGRGLPFALDPVRPLPARGSMRLSYTLPRAESVRLEVYDARGHRVRLLVATHQEAGRHTVIWDGLDARGSPAGSGVYFVRLSWLGGTRVARAALLR